MEEAEVMDSEASRGNDAQGQYLTFRVLNNRYAIDILDVKEIIEVTMMTRVPKAHASVRGVMNLRGNVAPVVDLAHRLQNKPLQTDRRTIILVVELEIESETQILGMLANEVNEIVEINAENIQSAPEFGAGIRREFIDRMARVDDEFIIMLNLPRVLNTDELSQSQAGHAEAVEAQDA
ncbi:chemotaxis protein CheW [Marinobacterium sp. YM272]|uniref:chemotaxis protein CheW n=1 Tax=Marinobacterium sp. YM272 TaxID=3421654 RepID=UPI003D7FEE92